MNVSAIKKLEIIRELSHVSEEQLDDIWLYIEALLPTAKLKSKHNRSLEGIWQNAKFEKILNLEDELVAIRKELSDSILHREL